MTTGKLIATLAGATLALVSVGTNVTYAIGKTTDINQQIIWGGLAVAACAFR